MQPVLLAAEIIDFRVFSSNNATTWFGGLLTILSIGAISALLLTQAFDGFFGLGIIWIL